MIALRDSWYGRLAGRGRGRFFGLVTPPALGSCGTASGSPSPASPLAAPRCSTSGRRRACGGTPVPTPPASRGVGRTRSCAFRRSSPSRSCPGCTFSRHRPDQTALLAYGHPARPAAVAAAVRVGHGALALRKGVARLPQAVVGELRVRARADWPDRC